MKRIGLLAMGIGIFITVGLITVEQGYPAGHKKNTDEQEEHATTCTLETLKGRYLFAGQGTLLPPAFSVTQPTPAAHAGFHLFNGDGTATEIVTFNLGGVTVLHNAVIPFQYTVNADCTGSYSLQNGLSFDLFIAPDGEEFASIPTAPLGGVLTTIDRRVSRK